METSRSIEIAVVGSGPRAGVWRARLEEHLVRTGNLATSPLRADSVAVVVDDSFVAATEEGIGRPDECLDAIRDAVAAGKILIPIAVEGAPVPDPDALPEALRPLGLSQGLALSRESELPGVAARIVAATRTATRAYTPPRVGDRRLFLSYRRRDSWYWATLLASALTKRVGARNVFFDLGSIAPGRRFDAEIEARVREATDFVILVGPAFLAPDRRGLRRIDAPQDFVRREILSALEHDTPTHLVLTGGAPAPAPERLPPDIAPAFEDTVPHLLPDHRAADPVASEILSRAPPGTTGSAVLLPGRREPRRLPDPHEQAERLVTAAVPPLAARGWRPVPRAVREGAVIMTRGDDDAYRFVLDFASSRLILQERARGLGGLGRRRWISRAAFPMGPATADVDVLRPPDRQVEAMENPGAYLDRTGRLDMDAVPRPPMDPTALDTLLQAAGRPGRRALGEQAREYARIRARGGLRVLRRARIVSLGGDVVARAVAADPTTGRLAVASDRGVHTVDAETGAVEAIRAKGHHRLVACSPRGMLATVESDHRILVFDGDERQLLARTNPYSLRGRIGHRPPFETLSWSDDGNRLAVGASDRVWIWERADHAFAQVELPRDARVTAASALFVPGSEELLVLQLWSLWRAGPDGSARGPDLDLSAGSEFHDPLPGGVMEPGGIRPKCLALSPDGRRLAIGANDAQTLLVDARTLRPEGLSVWHAPQIDGRWSGSVEALAFAPDSRWLASVANDGRLVLGETGTGASIADGLLSTETPPSGLPLKRDVCWTPDGRHIAVVDGAGKVEIFDAPERPR